MELQIGIDEFSRALYRAQGIVEKKSTMPILASVLLKATTSEVGQGRLRVSAFDLERQSRRFAHRYGIAVQGGREGGGENG